MHEQDARRRQAFGLGERDVVFLQGGDHVGSQNAHDPRPLGQRQRHRGQHHEAQIANRVLRERDIAGRRQPAQFNREKIDQQDCRKKGRHRQHGKSRAGHEAIERSATARGADNRQRHADRQRAAFRQQHQLDGYRQPLGNRLQHRLSGAERAAEIALQHMAEPAEIAPPDRLIQPHVTPQRRQVLRRRLVGEDGGGKIARQQRRDGERQQRDRNQHRQQIKQPARDKERHGRLFLPGARYVDHPAVHLG